MVTITQNAEWYGRSLPDLPKSRAGEMTIRVELLGSFRVRTDRGLIPDALWRGARAKGLFKYLAFRAGTPISRDALTDLLWPDQDPEACQNSLHKAVHMLRQTIHLALGWDGKELLEFSGGCYTLRADNLTVDTMQFKGAIFEAKWCHRLHDVMGARYHYEEAIRIYRGDLLEDDYAVEWAIPERERLRKEYYQALRTLAAMDRDAGNHAGSALYYRKLLTADPCAEDAYRALIEIAVANGHRGEALRLYRQCKEVLHREFAGVPSRDLDDLVAQL